MGDPLLPITNAGGFPVVHMTAPQAYIFDLKGWTCLPGLLSEKQIEGNRAHQVNYLCDREFLPSHERENHGGPSQILLDHPAVGGVFNEARHAPGEPGP